MALVAAIRPDDWNFPLFLHVLGAMLLVGATLTAASAFAFARGDARLVRLGHRTLLVVGLPSYVAMWIGAHWIYAKEGLDERPIESAWEAIGFAVTEVGAVLFVTALIVSRLAVGRGEGLLKAALTICILLLTGFAVAVWAMTAKPR
jgi:hypothetical protein